MTNIRVTIDDREVSEALGRLAEIGEHLDPILHAVGRVVETRVKQGFDTSTSPYGDKWQPLKLWLMKQEDGSYAYERIRNGPPLKDTGALRESITYAVDGNSVVIGTNREHMHVHQYGAIIRPKHAKALVFPGPGGALIAARKVTIPARPFLPTAGLPDEWADDVLHAIRDQVEGALKGGK